MPLILMCLIPLSFSSLIPLLLLILGSALSMKKSSVEWAKISPFECGFSPRNSFRESFSIHFFLMALIFVLFDLELVVVFPFFKTAMVSFSLLTLGLLTTFLVFMLVSLLWEWNQGALSWSN